MKILSIKYLFEYERTFLKLITLDWLVKKTRAYTLHAWFSLGFKVKPRQNHTLPLFAQFVTKNPGGKVSSGVFCLRLGAKNWCKSPYVCCDIPQTFSHHDMTWHVNKYTQRVTLISDVNLFTIKNVLFVSFNLHIFLWYFSADFQANSCTKSAEKSQRPRMDIDKKSLPPIIMRKDLNEKSENHHSLTS